jgi:hypothetical protein
MSGCLMYSTAYKQATGTHATVSAQRQHETQQDPPPGSTEVSSACRAILGAYLQLPSLDLSPRSKIGFQARTGHTS